MDSKRTWREIVDGQLLHAVLLAVLLGLTAGATQWLPLGGAAASWLWAGVGIAIAHQVWVLAWWRTELDLGWPSKLLGAAAFPVYRIGFALLGLSRFAAALGAATADSGSLPLPVGVRVIAAILLLAPGVWLVDSVRRHFGFDHAMGADHFFAEHRQRPLCREGIFRWIPNAMYTVGFLSFWAIGLGFGSTSALLLAAFSHAYIWVHYVCTERPDMRRIYA